MKLTKLLEHKLQIFKKYKYCKLNLIKMLFNRRKLWMIKL